MQDGAFRNYNYTYFCKVIFPCPNKSPLSLITL